MRNDTDCKIKKQTNKQKKTITCACSVVSDSVNLWTVAHQASLIIGFSNTGGVAIFSSRESSQPKDQTHNTWVSCIVGEKPNKLILFYTSKSKYII